MNEARGYVRQFECPTCHAQPGEKCKGVVRKTRTTRRERETCHRDRVDVANGRY